MKQIIIGCFFLSLAGCADMEEKDTSVILPENERMERIALDFNRNREEVKNYIARYFDVVTE